MRLKSMRAETGHTRPGNGTGSAVMDTPRKDARDGAGSAVERSSVVQRPSAPLAWTGEQEAIYEAVETLRDNLCVNASAGSGKSTTALEAAWRQKARGLRTLYVVFNKPAQVEMESKSAGICTALTYHSLGLRAISNAHSGGVNVNDRHMWAVIEGLRTWGKYERTLKGAVKKLASIAKQYGEESTEGLRHLLDHHVIDTGGKDAEVVSFTQAALRSTLAGWLHATESGRPVDVDFDDMVWLPQRLELDVPGGYDFAIVDECQDTNKVQQYLAQHAAPRTLIVGDRWQAIYGFRGADVAAMDNLRESLAAVSLPLTYTQRCPQRVVNIVQKLGVDIKVVKNAPEGLVHEKISLYSLATQVMSGDLVLCRVNAPLIETAYMLIARGIAAHIRGRDIADGIMTLLDKAERHTEAATVRQLLIAAQEITRKDTEKFMGMPDGRGEMRASAAMDRLACLMAAAQECQTPAQVKDKIARLFDESKGGVVLGTVHRMKGSEANRVWILKPELMPHPRATKAHEIQTEKNCLYVAITRVKFSSECEGQLNFVGEKPAWLN